MVIKLDRTKEEQNMRIYPIYKMLSWDLLFYYSINFIFLTQVKGFSASSVLLSEAFYPIFKIISQLPLSALVEKIGKRNSLILANSINALSILSYIIASNLGFIFLGQFFSAVAFNIKGIVETNLLYDSLPKDGKRGHAFSKIDGKGIAWYYYADAITSVASGFLYVINGYLPLILCLICCMISTMLVFKFNDVKKSEQESVNIKQYVKELRCSLKYMLQSSRLKCLFAFGATFAALLGVLISLRSGTFEQIGVPEQYFGVIFAALGIISGITAKNQHRIHNRFTNKTLAVISIPTTISCILVGFCVLGNLNFNATLVILITLFLIQFIAKGAFYTLIKRYLNNFTNSAMRNKITSAYNLIESIVRSGVALIASWLLKITTASNAMLVIGCILTIIIVLLLDKMRSKVGLKPEEYSKKEIEFLDVH